MVTIDTHTGYKKLVEAGVPERQAEATVHLFSEWVERELVTRDYLDLRMIELEKRLTNRIYAVAGLAVSINVALMGTLMAIF